MDQSLGDRIPEQWDSSLDRIRKQLPPAPEGLLNFYVQWIPWLAIIFGVIGLLFSVLGGLFVMILGPFLMLGGASAVAQGVGALIGLLLAAISSVLAIVGGVGMRRRSLSGWWILAAGLVLNFISDIIGLSILGLIITALFAYVHLQVKPRYK